jgi:MFS family permease
VVNGTVVGTRVRTTFQSLTVGNYRLFVSGQLLKQLGVWMQVVAQDWLVLELSNNSPTALGFVTCLQFLPVVLFSLYGGQLADRRDRRRLLILINAASCVLALGFGVLVTTHLVTLMIVFAFATLLGSVNAIEIPVRQAFVSDLVEPALLPNALGLNAAAFNSARIVGPAIAGVAIWLVGLGPVFLVTACFYLFPFLFLLRVRPSRLYGIGVDGVGAYGVDPYRGAGAHASKPRGDTRIRDGVAYVWRRQDLVLPLAMLLVLGLAGFNFQLTLSVLSKTVFHTGAQQFGLLTTTLAVGALAGALVSGSRRHRPSVYAVVGSGTAFGALETAAGIAPTFWTTAVLLVPTGFCMVFFAQAVNQRVQLGVSPEFRGRVMALWALVFMGTAPVGGPMVGFVSAHIGGRAGLWGGGLVSFLACVVALAWHLNHSGERLRVTLRPVPHIEVVPGDADSADGLLTHGV